MSSAFKASDYARCFYIVQHKDDRRRFRRRHVKLALQWLIRYARAIPGEQVLPDPDPEQQKLYRMQRKSQKLKNAKNGLSASASDESYDLDDESDASTIAADFDNFDQIFGDLDISGQDGEDDDTASVFGEKDMKSRKGSGRGIAIDDDEYLREEDEDEYQLRYDDDAGEEGEENDDEEEALDASTAKIRAEKMEKKLRAMSYNLYKVIPYVAGEASSWRVQLLLHLQTLRSFCKLESLPFEALNMWVRSPPLSSSSKCNKKANSDETDENIAKRISKAAANGKIYLAWLDDEFKPDPFFLVVNELGEMCLTRAAQRFLRDFSMENREFVDHVVGEEEGGHDEDGNDDDYYARDEEEDLDDLFSAEVSRNKEKKVLDPAEFAGVEVEAAQWCLDRTREWKLLFAKHMGNPCKIPWATQQRGPSGAEKKEQEKAKELEHLAKQLNHKKGKNRVVVQTKKQKEAGRKALESKAASSKKEEWDEGNEDDEDL